MMKGNNHLKKILVLPTLLVLVITGVMIFVFLSIKNKNEHISDLRNELAFQMTKQQNMISMDQLVEKARPDILLIDNSIIAKDGDVAFIEDLEEIARKNGLDINIESLSFEDNPQVASSTMTTLKVKAGTKGSWAGTYKFLAQVEALSFRVKVNNFAFVNSSDETVFNRKKTSNPQGWQSRFEISVLKYK
jgi:hypothetical protein